MDPMRARIDFTYLFKTHKASDDFPYTAAELAHALSFLCRYPDACKALEELDDNEVSDNDKYGRYTPEQLAAE